MDIEAQMLAQHKKGKGQKKVRPSTTTKEPLANVGTRGEDLLYLPPPTIVLGTSF